MTMNISNQHNISSNISAFVVDKNNSEQTAQNIQNNEKTRKIVDNIEVDLLTDESKKEKLGENITNTLTLKKSKASKAIQLKENPKPIILGRRDSNKSDKSRDKNEKTQEKVEVVRLKSENETYSCESQPPQQETAFFNKETDDSNKVANMNIAANEKIIEKINDFIAKKLAEVLNT